MHTNKNTQALFYY